MVHHGRRSGWRGLTALTIGISLTAASAACHDSAGIELDDLLVVPRDAAAAFQTDSLKYTLQAGVSAYNLTIDFTFKNLTRDTVYFINCHGLPVYSLEKYEGAEWVRAFTGIFPACFSPPIVIAAGAAFRNSARIWAVYPEIENAHPKFTVATVPGIYRMVFWNMVDSWNDQRQTWGNEIPAEYRVSNRFVLVAAPR